MKQFFKRLLDTLCTILVLPFFTFHFLMSKIGRTEGMFWGLSQFFSLFPGVFGNFLRKNFYRLALTHCDSECAILFGTILSQSDTEIGRGVYLGPNCNIGKCSIGKFCTIGSNVHIMSGKQQHNFEDLGTPIQEQGGVLQRVVIGEDTWVGNCAIIMAHVGKKCIIGAGSVVTKDVEAFSVMAGNPAKLIKKRV